MNQIELPPLAPELAASLADLYRRMEAAYDIVARQLDFSCRGCTDNCCDSYFLHHTKIEWAYLREGLGRLSAEEQAQIRRRAHAYRLGAQKALAAGERPALNCPLLREDGLCGLYHYRLMICRMHGVPSSLTFPNGRVQRFPGCFRCQELTAGRSATPTVERAPLLRELARLEQSFAPVGQPRIKMTIADMILD